MGEIAEAMISGEMCEACGEWIGEDVGYPLYCSIGCAKDRGADISQVVSGNNDIEQKQIHQTGTTVRKNSKQGGGEYVVIGVVNCSRCNTEVEEREVQVPTKKQRKKGSYYAQYTWCHECGLYEPKESSKTFIK